MAVKIQLREDTFTNWETANPILSKAEIGVVSDFDPILFKIGDGIHNFLDLPYANEIPDMSDYVLKSSLTKTRGEITVYDQRDGETYQDYIDRSTLSNSYNNVFISNSFEALNPTVYLPNIVNLNIGDEIVVFNNDGQNSIEIKLYPASYNQFEAPASLPNNGTSTHNNSVNALPQTAYKFIKGERGLGWSVFKIEQLDNLNNQIQTYKGDWTSGTNYKKGDIVTHFYGVYMIYLCIQDNNSTFSPNINGVDWLLFGMKKISTTNNFVGDGVNIPLALNYYVRSSIIYASGTDHPQRGQNYFTGMSLPDGVTETIVRTGTGTYELRYSGDVSIKFLDITDSLYYREVRLINNPDIRYTSGYNTTNESTITLHYEFKNTVNGVLTDGFSRLLYEIRFYK